MTSNRPRRLYGAACAAAAAIALLTFPGLEAQRQVFSVGTPAELAIARSAGIEQLAVTAQLRGVDAAADLQVASVHVDQLSMAHTRVRQLYRGVPVFGGEAIAHFGPDGSRFAETDDFVPFVSINTTPTIAATAAVAIAVAEYGCSDCLTALPANDLWVLRQGTVDHLVYRVQLRREDSSARAALPVFFVDAHNGAIVWRYDNLQTGTGPSLYSGNVSVGTTFNATQQRFYLENLLRRVGTFDMANTPSTTYYFTDLDDLWNAGYQRAGLDVQFASERYLDFLQTTYGRNGLDGSGGPYYFNSSGGTPLLSSRVHQDVAYNNASWNGYYMTYGDGDGTNYGPLVSLDIVAHEMTHAVTQFTADLVYQGEPGALNESWSDVFGAMLERHVRGESANTWLNGEDAYTPFVSGDAGRYFDDPHRASNKGYTADDDPDHYAERYTGVSDNGGVHINSGIPNKAFYLLAKGGAHHRGGSMTGIGADAAARIWYLALTSYMTSSTTFANARVATMQAAAALYGAGSANETAVGRAWCLVGVGTCVDVQAISVSPSSGSGTSQTFTLQYSDSQGAADLTSARVRFGAANVGPNTCTVWYDASSGSVSMLNDAGTQWQAAAFGSGTLQNGQCSLNLAASSATPNATALTLQLALTFKAPFAGAKSIYMLASSASGVSTGWLSRGTWTVPTALEAVSISPNAGAAASATFTMQYADGLGAAADLTSARVRFAASNVGPNTCTIWYNAVAQTVQLLDDAGATWQTAAFGSGTLSNSQCTLNLAASSATANGPNLTLSLNVSFKPAFAGVKNVYMLAGGASGASTGWVSRGTWTVPGSMVSAVSVAPDSGAGAAQVFTLSYADSEDAASITSARVRFGSSNVGPGTCTIWYDASTNGVQMLNDAGTAWQQGTLGTGTLENAQCRLQSGSSSANLNGQQLTLSLSLVFKPAFSGVKNVYMLAANAGTSTGWVLRGTWTPNPESGPGEVAAVSVTPSATPSPVPVPSQTFTLRYTDTAGAADLASARVRFSTGASLGAGTCTVWYSAMTGSVQLLNDAGTAWATGSLGSGTLDNGQCTVQLASSSATPTGNTLDLALAIAFKPSFTGLKNIYMLAASATGANTGWLPRGSWTAFAEVPTVLSAISATPSSGTGSSQVFDLEYFDPIGAASDLASARLRFAAGPGVGAATCTVAYNAMTGSIQMLDDAGTFWQIGALGSGTLQNSQCTVDLVASAATANGGRLSLQLSIAFSSAFQGPKTIYMLAGSAGGASTGWVVRGAWNVPSLMLSRQAEPTAVIVGPASRETIATSAF